MNYAKKRKEETMNLCQRSNRIVYKIIFLYIWYMKSLLGGEPRSTSFSLYTLLNVINYSQGGEPWINSFINTSNRMYDQQQDCV